MMRRFRNARLFLFLGLLRVLPGTVMANATEGSPILHMVAVAHLDTQWRWTVRETIDPYLRNTLVDNFRFFEKYPDYQFNFEGAFRYALMKSYYPDLYKQLKTFVEAGRWHVSGPALDALDVILPEPESVIRNILYAQRFFRQEFGLTARDAFLPDCFGFPITFPTIANHCGLTAFSTQKLGWGAAVGIPFQVGVWEGLGGNRLPAVLHAGPYNWQLRRDVSQHEGLWLHLSRQIEQTGFPIGYRYFGVGDRGGAPDESTVAWIADAVRAGEGPLKVQFAASDAIFKAMRPEHLALLPQYQGELLMTRHGVGSYTTYGATKRWGRLTERLAVAAERSALAAFHEVGAPYPKTALNEAWLRFLWHHQHDGITGTSVPDANDIMINDQVISYNQFSEILRESITRRAAALTPPVAGQALLLYNPSPFARQDVVEVDWPAPIPDRDLRVLQEGRPIPSQVVRRPGEPPRLFVEADVPALGLAVYSILPMDKPPPPATSPSLEDGVTLSMGTLQLRINAQGQIASILDRETGREWLQGPIEWQFLSNSPDQWPAWEIEFADIESDPVQPTKRAVKIGQVESGPLRASVRVSIQYDETWIHKEIALVRRAGMTVIEINADIHWQTFSRLLKVGFPLHLQNPVARYDVGLGHVERGVNTESLYEVPALNWAGLGEQDGSAGLVICSESKAGWDRPQPNVLRHTLIHSPNALTTDFGHHRVRFTLVPRSDNWPRHVHHLSEQITQPFFAFATHKQGGTACESLSFAELDNPDVRLLALKQAETDPRLIVRTAEVSGHAQADVRLRFPGRPIQAVREVNGLEDDIGPGVFAGNNLVFSMQPNQVRTWAICFAAPPPSPPSVMSYPMVLDYDLDLVANPGVPGQGNRFAASEFPETLTLGSVSFTLADVDDSRGQAMRCRGQTLAWNAPAVNAVHLLVASRDGDRSSVWRVGRHRETRRVPDLFEAIGLWDRTEHDEESGVRSQRPGWTKRDRLAWHATRLIDPEGKLLPYTYAYLHAIEIPVPPGVQSMTVPNDPALLVFAASAVFDPDPDVRSLMNWQAPAQAAPRLRMPSRRPFPWVLVLLLMAVLGGIVALYRQRS